jgi:hypothetical protein
VRPVPGQGFTLLREPETYAHLALRNRGRAIRGCMVRLESLQYLNHGHLLGESLQPRPLHWSTRETTAYGTFHELLDLPGDGLEHYLDVGAVARGTEHFTVVSADPQDRPRFGRGWYRLIVAIASIAPETRYTQREEFLLGLHPRDGSVPAPLELYKWHPRGPKIMEESRHNR